MEGGGGGGKEELVIELPIFSDSESEEGKGSSSRGMCWDGCGRPSSVCICPYLPSKPIATETTIVLLHHPHALRPTHAHSTLSTLPPLSSSLLNLHLVSSRKLHLGSHPLLDSLHNSSSSAASRSALFLFPSLPSSQARPISLWAHRSPVLVVFDGTWRQAREMVAASLPFLSAFAAHVTIGEWDAEREGPSSFESELAVRKEPAAGCVSTMEAVARALRVLEPEGPGEEVEEKLLGILRAMVGFQMQHWRPVKPRMKMLKRKEMSRRLSTTTEEPEGEGVNS